MRFLRAERTGRIANRGSGNVEVEAGQVVMTSDSAPQISIIIPTRNESENIRPLLIRLSESLSEFSIETIFVDDSNDDTADVITSVEDQFSFPVRLIARPPQQRNGLSGAVVDGFAAADGQWVCVMDADLQHPPETIISMWEQAQKTGTDMVVGSRRGDLFGPFGLSRLRSLNSKLLTIFARTLFPRRLKNVSDPLTGLFLVRLKAVDVDALRPDGFKILLEILVRNPALQVSEVYFDFSPRHSGESKADVREGGRFFRHLVTLRSTANPHLGRFLVVTLLSILGNTGLFAIILNWNLFPPTVAALLAAELTWLAIFFALEIWVFSERESDGRRRRFWGYFLLTQIGVFAVHLPIFYVLSALLGANLLLANLISFIVVGLVRYLLSEQWVWTRSAMAWQSQRYFYNLHDLLRIESQVPLRDLDYFSADFSTADADIQVRVDRQGTPTYVPGGISYDDQLGRFGFGLTVVPGDYTQVVVSPLLEHSPDFLYTNIIEPILRWRLVQKGYAMVKAACVAKGKQAVLISADQDLGLAVSQLCEKYDYAFLADDLTILDARGNVYNYPKPLTVDRSMLDDTVSKLNLNERAALVGQRLLYTRYMRQIGLWLSDQDLPAATINTYMQRFIPQPKEHLQKLFPQTDLVNAAELNEVICVFDTYTPETADQNVVDRLQQSEIVAAFQPHPLLAEKLQSWGEEDLVMKEQKIIIQAVRNVPVRFVDAEKEAWWLLIESGNRDDSDDFWSVQPGLDQMTGHVSDPHGEPETS